MNIGIPLETRDSEQRVGLMPAAVRGLAGRGHTVFVEAGAGLGSGFGDDEYRNAGAEIVYSADEVYRRSEVVVRVGPLLPTECGLLERGQTIIGFQHLAVAPPAVLEAARRKEITLIAYETMQDARGTLPVLIPMSEIAGRLSVQVAAHYLEGQSGGKGVLLGGLPGVPPARVGILGAGVVGTNAARAFAGLGAQVTVLDRDLPRLEHLDEVCGGRVSTAFASRSAIERLAQRVDVLVGAVLVPGARTPVLVDREMVRQMPSRSVIVDISIDQGGCVETSRPTTNNNPVFVEEDVIHYCVPNMPGKVAHTATHALNNVVLPYLIEVADNGVKAAIAADPVLASGVVMHRGRLVNPLIAEALGVAAQDMGTPDEGVRQ